MLGSFCADSLVPVEIFEAHYFTELIGEGNICSLIETRVCFTGTQQRLELMI
ncbi:hypothetical protein BaRGS_00028941, partial [Batillaria attramentaria]